MSSAVLPLVQNQCNFYSALSNIFFGTVGNVFILILFRQRRQNSGAICLLCASVFSGLNILVNLPLKISGWNLSDPANYYLSIYKLRFCTGQAWSQISRYMIVLACIDRYILTTNNVRLQTIRRSVVVRRIVGIVVVFWHLFSTHLSIQTTIRDGRCGQFDLYNLLYVIYYVIFVCSIPSLSITIFGFLAYRNQKKLHLRIQPIRGTTEHNMNTICRRDRELLRMVLFETVVYLFTNFLYPIIYLESVATNLIGVKKSLLYVQIESFISAVGVALLYLNNAVPFYTYLTASRVFRKDVNGLLTEWKRQFMERFNATLNPRRVHPLT